MSTKLNPGDPFPSMQLNAADGTTVDLPGGSETPLTLVLFYRGHW
jgi:peroxiredoxin